jgi:hypothetical protein
MVLLGSSYKNGRKPKRCRFPKATPLRARCAMKSPIRVSARRCLVASGKAAPSSSANDVSRFAPLAYARLVKRGV